MERENVASEAKITQPIRKILGDIGVLFVVLILGYRLKEPFT